MEPKPEEWLKYLLEGFDAGFHSVLRNLEASLSTILPPSRKNVSLQPLREHVEKSFEISSQSFAQIFLNEVFRGPLPSNNPRFSSISTSQALKSIIEWNALCLKLSELRKLNNHLKLEVSSAHEHISDLKRMLDQVSNLRRGETLTDQFNEILDRSKVNL